MFTVWLYFSMSSVRKKERGKKKKERRKRKSVSYADHFRNVLVFFSLLQKQCSLLPLLCAVKKMSPGLVLILSLPQLDWLPGMISCYTPLVACMAKLYIRYLGSFIYTRHFSAFLWHLFTQYVKGIECVVGNWL